MKHIQIIGVLAALFYAGFVGFIYLTAPRSIEDVAFKARETIEKATTSGQVLTGLYEVDQAKFSEGLEAFRAENYPLAKDQFSKADPENRDPNTQFYIAYSDYRQGWGRFSNDDLLFERALKTLDRVELLNKNFSSSDPDLKLKTPAELRNELSEGLRVTADDFNPLKIVRERK